jgi:osmoprotectant transport system permease protein
VIFKDIVSWLMKNSEYYFGLLLDHIWLTITLITISVILGVVVGIVITKYKVLAKPIINLANAFYTVPSIALFGLLIPFLGIGFKPAIVALVLYVQFIIISHTHVGMTKVDSDVIESAKGMGLTEFQQLIRVRLPIAMPIIIAGIRTATTLTIGIVAIAAFIGAEGLGVLIFRGISGSNTVLILIGSITLFLLSIITDVLLSRLEKIIIPRGLRG